MFAKIFSKKNPEEEPPKEVQFSKPKRQTMFARVFSRRNLTITIEPRSLATRLPNSKVWYENCHIEDFELGCILGTGSFGQVHLAYYKATKQVCATKSLSKAVIVKTKQVLLFVCHSIKSFK
ncbi:hypothetical protein O6H91_Y293200 [Diphasiastrum complanatum]|nr:hypothetical protein O6H91_Y293200 [Diphasiastrum complanatum]